MTCQDWILPVGENAPHHMFKQFLISGKPTMCLVDTGAISSLVRASALTPAQAALMQPPNSMRLLGASGHAIEIVGTVTLPVSRDGVSFNQQFAVTDDGLPVLWLLGLDMIRPHIHVLYPDSGRIVMRQRRNTRLHMKY